MKLGRAGWMALALGLTPAAPALAGDPIWRDIEAGMSADDVRALYPAGRADGRQVEHHRSKTELHGFLLMGKCKPRVEVLHPQGRVTGVSIWMEDAGFFRSTCAQDARAAVLSKFGTPDTQDNRPARFGDRERYDIETLTWATPSMTVIWRFRAVREDWSIEYLATAPANADQL